MPGVCDQPKEVHDLYTEHRVSGYQHKLHPDGIATAAKGNQKDLDEGMKKAEATDANFT